MFEAVISCILVGISFIHAKRRLVKPKFVSDAAAVEAVLSFPVLVEGDTVTIPRSPVERNAKLYVNNDGYLSVIVESDAGCFEITNTSNPLNALWLVDDKAFASLMSYASLFSENVVEGLHHIRSNVLGMLADAKLRATLEGVLQKVLYGLPVIIDDLEGEFKIYMRIVDSVSLKVKGWQAELTIEYMTEREKCSRSYEIHLHHLLDCECSVTRTIAVLFDPMAQYEIMTCALAHAHSMVLDYLDAKTYDTEKLATLAALVYMSPPCHFN